MFSDIGGFKLVADFLLLHACDDAYATPTRASPFAVLLFLHAVAAVAVHVTAWQCMLSSILILELALQPETYSQRGYTTVTSLATFGKAIAMLHYCQGLGQII